MPTARSSSTARATAKEIYGNTLAATIAGVRDDEKVKAVVLRVNSPGGSALASGRHLARNGTARKPRNPVVVSMGSYAASGGYYISCPADVIVADKLPLTGSIGVFGMILDTREALKNKLGITDRRREEQRLVELPRHAAPHPGPAVDDHARRGQGLHHLYERRGRRPQPAHREGLSTSPADGSGRVRMRWASA